jgi:hypothetical protein
MPKPCSLFKHFPHEVIDEIIWGGNLDDLIRSLRTGSLVRFATAHNGEIWLSVRHMAAGTIQEDPHDRHDWYITGHYENFEAKEKLCTLDYDDSTGEGWIKLDGFKPVA